MLPFHTLVCMSIVCTVLIFYVKTFCLKKTLSIIVFYNYVLGLMVLHNYNAVLLLVHLFRVFVSHLS